MKTALKVLWNTVVVAVLVALYIGLLVQFDVIAPRGEPVLEPNTLYLRFLLVGTVMAQVLYLLSLCRQLGGMGK